jgi:hypothetical protein
MALEVEPIVNKVANSPLITLDLEEFYHPGERVVYDIKENLFQELILKEKEFREFINDHDWSKYQDKNVALTCTVDAVVPTWAYMLLASKIEPYAHLVVFGKEEILESMLFQEALSRLDFPAFQDKKVVVKGCSKVGVPTFAYVEITRKLRPYASSIMYGEPCSTVPIYKKTKNL